MLRRLAPVALIALLIVPYVLSTETGQAPQARAATTVELLDGWQIQSSCEAKAAGELVSKTGFRTSGWHQTTVPNTVVGALVDDKTYADPTYGTNMKNLPGINYRANVWFNGQKLGDAKEIAGTYRIFEFDLTELAKPGAKNVIALEISAPGKEDLGITWVDWNPTPADKNLGIWKTVTLGAHGPVVIRNPFVRTQLNADLTAAELTVSADLRNDS